MSDALALAGITMLDVKFISNVIVFLSFTFWFLNKVVLPTFAPPHVKRDPFLLAFELTCFVPLAYCAIVGTSAWLHDVNVGYDTAFDRLYKPAPESARRMILVNLAFQLWDLLISYGRKELNSLEMLAHHALAATLCAIGLHVGFVQYYGIYFLGVTEVSSLPLVYVDSCKFYPAMQRARPGLDLVAKVLFGLSFVAVRDVYFIKYSKTLWEDSLKVLGDGSAKFPKLTVGFLCANVFFVILQLTWTKLLIDGLIDMFRTPKYESESKVKAGEVKKKN